MKLKYSILSVIALVAVTACESYLDKQPEELPSMPVKSVIQRTEPPKRLTGFAKFNFDLEDDGND